MPNQSMPLGARTGDHINALASCVLITGISRIFYAPVALMAVIYL